MEMLLGFLGGGEVAHRMIWTKDFGRLVSGEVGDGDCSFIAGGINDCDRVVCGVGIGGEGN